MCMAKCRVVPSGLMVLLKSKARGYGKSDVSCQTVIKNDVWGTVAPHKLAERSRGNAYKGATPQKGPPW